MIFSPRLIKDHIQRIEQLLSCALYCIMQGVVHEARARVREVAKNQAAYRKLMQDLMVQVRKVACYCCSTRHAACTMFGIAQQLQQAVVMLDEGSKEDRKMSSCSGLT